MSMELLDAAVRRSRFTPFPVKPTAAPPVITRAEYDRALDRISMLEHQIGVLSKRLDFKRVNAPIPVPPAVAAINDIKRVVCETYEITENELISSDRSMRLCRIRMIAIYLCSKHSPLGASAIARRFGDRDHTTILSARNKVGYRIRHEEKLAAEIRYLEERLGVSDDSFAPADPALGECDVREPEAAQAGPLQDPEVSRLDQCG